MTSDPAPADEVEKSYFATEDFPPPAVAVQEHHDLVPVSADNSPPQDSASQESIDDDDDPTPSMTIGEHLEELRKRIMLALVGLVATMTVSMIYGKDLIRLIEYPFTQAMTKVGMQPELAWMEVTGAFGIYLKVAFYVGLVLASPWVFYQLWMFVGAGLYSKEKRYVKMAVPFSVFLFLAGAAFAVMVSIPAIEFFIVFGKDLGAKPVITLPDYISFMTQLLLVFGIVFQLPLVVLVLAKIGLVDMKMLNRFRRHVIVGIGVVAAIFAPADIISMIVMILCMCVLYEFGVVLAWVLVLRKRAKEEALLEAEDAAAAAQEDRDDH